MAVSGGTYRDAGAKVEEFVAVHISEYHASIRFHRARISVRVRGQDEQAINLSRKTFL
jgi:hypothetical protein